MTAVEDPERSGTAPLEPPTGMGPGEGELMAPATDQLGEIDGIVRRVARGGLWSIFGFGASAGSAFIISILLGRTLGPADFGRFSYALFLLRLLPSIVALGIPAALAKMVAEKEGSGHHDQVNGLWRFARRGHLLVLPLPTLIATVLVWNRPSGPLLALILAVGIFVGLYLLDYDGMLTGLRRFRTLGIFSSFVSVTQLVAVALGIWLGLEWEALVALFVGISTVGLIVLAAITRQHTSTLPPPALPPAERARFVRLSGILLITLVLNTLVWGRPELLFIDWFGTDRDLGFYSAALRISSLAIVVPLVAGRALIPEFSRLLGGDAGDKVQQVYPRVCTLLAAVAAPLALIGMGLAGPIVTTVYGSDYDQAATAAAVLLAGSLVSALGPPATAAVLTGPRPRLVAELGSALVVINLVLDFFLIRAFGIVGAAAGTVTAQALGVVGGTFYAWRWLGLRYPVGALVRSAAIAAGAGIGGGRVAVALDGVLGVAVGGAIAMVVYVTLIAVTKTVTRDDVRTVVGRS